ncbi:adenylyl-sulfate kinase [Schlegelella sp. S2-27]|uniref:Adenylyl-sulfate kinase n=1 Tax=Caldimonas mangrovi TaxID=2944811 RepID=A0ABT0YMQ2_9BURK|nr:adenylyl-sulfate kinase [Caldimonas mangrovi]MCM5680005.1 adenylyl-sulfate kinase [Caldimonas mangrovi]
MQDSSTDTSDSMSPTWPMATVWITGLSGAGKSTLALQLYRAWRSEGRPVLVLDGDAVRSGLNRDLGFSAEDRHENIRRAAEVARLANEGGVWVMAAFIAPLAVHRSLAREIIGNDRFIEVYLSTPFDVCAARDPKGLYAQAKAGAIANFTGVGAAYEPPVNPHLSIDTSRHTPQQAADLVLDLLLRRLER